MCALREELFEMVEVGFGFGDRFQFIANKEWVGSQCLKHTVGRLTLWESFYIGYVLICLPFVALENVIEKIKFVTIK